MFSSARDASKVALVHLVGRLIIGGYRLLDAQFMTDHLTQFGAVEMTRSEYRRALAKALPLDADFYRLAPTTLAGGDASFAGEADAVGAGAGVLQAITQTS
jgi:leucyl/phenylalanyl-tRNA--protein transferase